MANLTKQQVNSLYSGIIAPQGGAYTPGPPVMLPPQGAGQNKALAQALVDPAGNGAPSWDQFDDWVNDPNSWSGADIPHANGTIQMAKDTFRLPSSPAANAFAYGDGVPVQPASAAIGKALLGGQPDGMNWETPNPEAAPQGDPWNNLRLGATPVAKPGMVTANTGRNLASHLPAGSPIAGLATGGLRGMFANTPIARMMSGLGALGNPAVYSANTKPAISAYQSALQAAAQKNKTTPEAIHAHLMAQQTTSQAPAAQAAINAGKSTYNAGKSYGALGENAMVATDTIGGGVHRSG